VAQAKFLPWTRRSCQPYNTAVAAETRRGGYTGARPE
jgi:hypothetical protein